MDKPTCEHEDDGAVCGDPARWKVHVPAANTEPAYVCDPHFHLYAQVGNAVYELDA